MCFDYLLAVNNGLSYYVSCVKQDVLLVNDFKKKFEKLETSEIFMFSCEGEKNMFSLKDFIVSKHFMDPENSSIFSEVSYIPTTTIKFL